MSDTWRENGNCENWETIIRICYLSDHEYIMMIFVFEHSI